MMQSEFGKGLAICLVKFAEHYERWSRDRVREEEMAVKTGRTDLFNERHSVESFFNAASDHLYEIEVPATWKKKKIARKVRELQDFALMIGHGFTDRQHSSEDVDKAYSLCRQIALLLDKEIGLKPDIGTW